MFQFLSKTEFWWKMSAILLLATTIGSAVAFGVFL